MKNYTIFALLALGALGTAGCATDYSGTYKGEGTESGTITIGVPGGSPAKNESPPRKVADQTVTVTKDGGGYTVKFATCEMKGNQSTPKLLVASNKCNVKVVNYEGELPLSATLNFDDSGALTMEVTGTTKNDTTVINYNYSFKGKK